MINIYIKKISKNHWNLTIKSLRILKLNYEIFEENDYKHKFRQTYFKGLSFNIEEFN
jgi:hypothetical protein